MNFILSVILVSSINFGNPDFETNQMNPQEQEIAKQEISEIVNTIFLNLEKLDADALFQSYSNSPEFTLFTTNGLKVGLQETREEHVTWFNTLSSLNVTTISIDFNFLSDNNVVCSWQGKFEIILRTGEKARINRFGITFIFKKTGNSWKVIHQHSSALPPVKEVKGD